MQHTTNPAHSRPSAREFGLTIGEFEPGPLNAITDVAGVLVGQTTVSFGEGALTPKLGPARTGVTIVRPHSGNLFLDKVPAAAIVINGYGKTTGLVQIDELGSLETPIALTSTLCVGRVSDALITHAVMETPSIGITTSTVNPVVGECNDGYLNDIQGRHVNEKHVLDAISTANSGPVEEGSVGAGLGMTAFGFKGGIGTSSRRLAAHLGGWTVGTMVLANFGAPRQLIVDGVPIGRLLQSDVAPMPERGSIIVIVATDAPLLDRGLKRIARRAGIGLARTGSMGGHGSGDVVIAFSNNLHVRIPHFADGLTNPCEIVSENGPDGDGAVIDALFTAAIETTEEAILNALFRATTVIGRDGHVRHALPLDRVFDQLSAAGRLAPR